MPRLLAALLAAAACLLALTCAAPALAADGVPAAAQPDELLFTQTAARGTLTPTKCKCDGRYILTLRGVDKHTVWFSDRPNRHAGHMRTRYFARGWAGYGFRADPPDAALSAIDASGRRRSDIVELTHPRYNAKRRSMRYVVRTVPLTTGPLKVSRGRDSFAPGRLRDVSLFIDRAPARVINGCLLAPGTACQNVNLSNLALAGVNLSGANLYWAVFQNTDLTGANLYGAGLLQADLSGANLTDANLNSAGMWRADLTGANLTDADMTYVDLRGAKMAGVDLTGVDLTGSDLTGADLSGVIAEGVTLCHTTMPDGSIRAPHCGEQAPQLDE